MTRAVIRVMVSPCPEPIRAHHRPDRCEPSDGPSSQPPSPNSTSIRHRAHVQWNSRARSASVSLGTFAETLVTMLSRVLHLATKRSLNLFTASAVFALNEANVKPQ